MTNNCSGLTSLHRCANTGLNPPSGVHNPQDNHFNFVAEGVNAAWRAGQFVFGWVGLVKFRFDHNGEIRMVAYRLGDAEVSFSQHQQEKLVFRAADFSAADFARAAAIAGGAK